MRQLKPFLRWAGGKGQLLPEIRRYYPFDRGFTKYAEPFVGGGAVLFDILSRYRLESVYVGDISPELINLYRVVRDSPDELISLLHAMEGKFIPLSTEQRREYYLDKRDTFNFNKSRTATECAALMMFLNRTCFNGLYRVNRKGKFNVCFGTCKGLTALCDDANIHAASQALKNAEIVCGGYEQAADFIDGKTFVYLDPPYRPLNKTANFTRYARAFFTDDDQIRLAQFAKQMAQRGAKVLVSNSNPRNTNPNDDFFDKLYSEFNINQVLASRGINSDVTKRGKISELLISS